MHPQTKDQDFSLNSVSIYANGNTKYFLILLNSFLVLMNSKKALNFSSGLSLNAYVKNNNIFFFQFLNSLSLIKN